CACVCMCIVVYSRVQVCALLVMVMVMVVVMAMNEIGGLCILLYKRIGLKTRQKRYLNTKYTDYGLCKPWNSRKPSDAPIADEPTITTTTSLTTTTTTTTIIIITIII